MENINLDGINFKRSFDSKGFRRLVEVENGNGEVVERYAEVSRDEFKKKFEEFGNSFIEEGRDGKFGAVTLVELAEGLLVNNLKLNKEELNHARKFTEKVHGFVNSAYQLEEKDSLFFISDKGNFWALSKTDYYHYPPSEDHTLKELCYLDVDGRVLDSYVQVDYPEFERRLALYLEGLVEEAGELETLLSPLYDSGIVGKPHQGDNGLSKVVGLLTLTDELSGVYRKGRSKEIKDCMKKLEGFSERFFHYVSNKSDCTKEGYLHFVNDKNQPLSMHMNYYQSIGQNKVRNWFLRDKREMSDDVKKSYI